MLIRFEELVALIRELLEDHGVRSRDAQLVAELLADADLSGYDSHGAAKVPGYVEKLQAETIVPDAEPGRIIDEPGSLVIDGRWGFGQPAAVQLIDGLVEKAAAVGSSSGTIERCNDLGRLAPFVLRAAERGFIAFLAANDGGYYPQVAPWGGTEALFGTNPIAFAAPIDGEQPLVFDMSTSVLAAGKLLLAADRGEAAPPGTVIDTDGVESRDPSLIATDPKGGSILPLGAPSAGHKGYALAIMVDVLAGALTGAGTSASGAERHTQGVFCHVIDPGAFTSVDKYRARMLQLRQAVHGASTATGVTGVHLPGEGAATARSRNSTTGIPLDPVLWRTLQELARGRS